MANELTPAQQVVQNVLDEARAPGATAERQAHSLVEGLEYLKSLSPLKIHFDKAVESGTGNVRLETNVPGRSKNQYGGHMTTVIVSKREKIIIDGEKIRDVVGVAERD